LGYPLPGVAKKNVSSGEKGIKLEQYEIHYPLSKEGNA
jgi:hypothetical protein